MATYASEVATKCSLDVAPPDGYDEITYPYNQIVAYGYITADQSVTFSGYVDNMDNDQTASRLVSGKSLNLYWYCESKYFIKQQP